MPRFHAYRSKRATRWPGTFQSAPRLRGSGSGKATFSRSAYLESSEGLLSFDLIQVHKEILNLALEAWKYVFTVDQVFFAH